MRLSGSVPVRAASEGDLTLLASAIAASPLMRAYGADAHSLERRWVEALRAGDGMLVAADEGLAFGLCWFKKRGAFGLAGYLQFIGVVEGAQGKGVGSLLLDAFERGCGDPPGGWMLLASDFNAEAHRFYQRHGYREVGRLPDFAKRGIAEVVFWKPRP